MNDARAACHGGRASLVYPRNASPLVMERTPETPAAQKAFLKARALDLGFDAFGVAPVAADLRSEYFQQWIAKGQHGEMAWLARDPERRLDPRQVLPEARSIVVVGLNYFQPELQRRGRIAKYALGADYHRFMLKRLKLLCTEMRSWGGAQRPYVDTGPVLEKPVAAAAGIGWQAKNTLVINQQHGQWLFLGVILTTLELPVDTAGKDRCGSCTRCIDVCPTQAITAPYQLDARRCISYLTIEHSGAIPEALRRPIGNHLFGCDDCLDVCPWNKWAQLTRESKLTARTYPDLVEMLQWDETTFAQTFAGTPMKRSGLRRWKRNTCIVLGNTGTRHDLPPLREIAAGEDALLAEHAAWAIGEIESREEAST